MFDALDKVPFCMEFLTYAVRPDRKERLAWDFYILVLVIYSSITGPYTAAFVGDQEMSFFEILCDFSFYVDMVFSFWTGFDKGFEVVMEKKKKGEVFDLQYDQTYRGVRMVRLVTVLHVTNRDRCRQTA